MTPYATARRLYRKYGFSWRRDLHEYSRSGIVYIGHDAVLLARRIDDGWFVRLAVGDIRRIWSLRPHDLPWIGWARAARGRNHVVWWPAVRAAKLIENLTHEHRKFTTTDGAEGI